MENNNEVLNEREKNFVHVLSTVNSSLNSLLTFDGIDPKVLIKVSKFKQWVNSIETPTNNNN